MNFFWSILSGVNIKAGTCEELPVELLEGKVQVHEYVERLY